MLSTNNSVRIVNMKWSTGEKRGTKTHPVIHIILYCYPTAGDGPGYVAEMEPQLQRGLLDGGFINR